MNIKKNVLSFLILNILNIEYSLSENNKDIMKITLNKNGNALYVAETGENNEGAINNIKNKNNINFSNFVLSFFINIKIKT